MVKWPKNDATRGNQYPEPNISVTIFGSLTTPISSYAGPKKIYFVSNFTKIRTNFKRENKKYFLCRNPGYIDFNNQLISGPDSRTVQLRQFPNAADLSPTNVGIYLAMDHFETTITDIMMTTHWSQNHNHPVRLVVAMGSATAPLVTLGCWMSVQQLLHPTM